MRMRNIVAIDLGASSGRVMLAKWQPGLEGITLREIRRFQNLRQPRGGYDCWDLDSLFNEIQLALTQIDDEGIVPDSIGIDTWGVDLVFLDAEGQRVGETISYRDLHSQGVMEQAIAHFGRVDLYHRTGIQFLPFNTLYQLRALHNQPPTWLPQIKHALLIPDYLHYRLTGQLNWEYTNVTTTQLWNINDDKWDASLLQWAGVDPQWFGQPTAPGKTVGHYRSANGHSIPVIAVATHDTASAVVATPLLSEDAAYLCSGTWSLMGVESLSPFTSQVALDANLTNEGGAEGYRVLKNIMGMWLLQRVCQELNITDLTQLVADAAQQPDCLSLINPNDSRFINPKSMVEAIQSACAEQAMPIPRTAAALARTIFDSLALLYQQVLHELECVQDAPIGRLHIVGGGSQNPLLNQLCADACQIPVLAGPIEASTLGNVGCQLISLGELRDVLHLRQCITANFPLALFEPRQNSKHFASKARFAALTTATQELAYD